MTKKQMIATIQQTEAAAWLELRKCILYFGREANATLKSRREWCSIQTLMDKLSIKTDYTLADNLQAREVNERIKNKEEKVM